MSRGVTADLTAFHYDLLATIDRGDDELRNLSGQALKDYLEDEFDTAVNHGKLYPNLDELVRRGLVEKGQIDRRTNYYELTADGRRALAGRARWLTDADDPSDAAERERAMTDGGIDTTNPRLGAERACEPYGEVLDAARARLDEDDPDMVFLVTARVDGQKKSSHLDGPKAWTGATVGKRPALMRPGEISDADLADELVEHILATLLLETEYGGADLAHKLAEIETAMEFSPGGSR